MEPTHHRQTPFALLAILLFTTLFLQSEQAVAATKIFSKISIYPEHAGIFTTVKEQQYVCFGTRLDGTVENITTEVDWFVEDNPLFYQPLKGKEVITINNSGKATTLSSWGRASISACYPKGCGPNNTAFVPGVSLLLQKRGFRVTVDGTYGGVITSAPAGISCGRRSSKCSSSFLLGSTAFLTAEPADGYQHGKWSGDCSGSTSEPCLVSDNSNVGATFTVEDRSTL